MAVVYDDVKLLRIFDRLVKKAKSQVQKERTDIFDGWSDERKILYMTGYQEQLPEPTTAPDLKPSRGSKHAIVPVIF